MAETAQLRVDGKTLELPIVTGSEGERGIDITQLRAKTGYITLDPGYANTGSCKSAITFIDGEQGILRYRGIPIEQLAEKSTFLEVAYLLIYGSLPTSAQLDGFVDSITIHTMLHEDFKRFFGPLPKGPPSDGGRLGRGRRAGHVLPRLARSAQRAPGRDLGAPADREDDHDGRLRVQALDRAAVHLSEDRAVLLRHLPAHDVRNAVRALRGGPDDREGARPAPDPARRSRAELLHEHRAARGLVDGEPVRLRVRGGSAPLGAAPRGAPTH